MRYLSFLLLSFTIFACTQPSTPEAPSFPQGEWIDLTYPFDRSTVYWPTSQPFGFDTVFAGMTDKGYYYSAFNIQGAEHGGTHIDAPVHFAEGKIPVDEIPIEELVGEAVVVDVFGQCRR